MAAAEAAEGGGAQRVGRIFYGNDVFYIFFRLHQLLYDRCPPACLPACCCCCSCSYPLMRMHPTLLYPEGANMSVYYPNGLGSMRYRTSSNSRRQC